MKIGIIGAGKIGGTLGRLWVQAGHDVCFGVRTPTTVQVLVSELGRHASVGDAARAIHFGDVVVFAGPYSAWPELARTNLSAMKDKIVVDAGNPFPARDGAITDAVMQMGGGSGTYTAHLLPGARVVKAFNTVYWTDLRDKAHQAGEQLAMPMAGDHDSANKVVSQLAKDAGFDPVWLGALARSSALDPGSAIYAKSFTAALVRKALKLDEPS
jgi:8-hydroxy-5-deazaflavin:NADPH oxidoreductase